VSFEPGGDFVFPEGEAQDSIVLGGRTIKPVTVPISEFMKFTKIPIIIYYGDNIPQNPSTNPGQEQWRVFLEIAKKWRDAVNRHGGDVTVVHLPEIGIHDNTHFPFSDLNNVVIADQVSKWLKEKGLDHTPPSKVSQDVSFVGQHLNTKQQAIIPIAAFTANGNIIKLKSCSQRRARHWNDDK
jgi:hypothetical protein